MFASAQTADIIREKLLDLEESLEKARQLLVDQGLALVLRIRKQEAAARTWYVEAFQRDRGVGD
jgi:hypothetical protein